MCALPRCEVVWSGVDGTLIDGVRSVDRGKWHFDQSRPGRLERVVGWPGRLERVVGWPGRLERVVA
jgi:hypothetical protein